MMRSRQGLLFLGTLAAFTLFASGTAAFAASETHVFDATLSLTGGCSTSSAVLAVDPIPDPSCPGGPLPPSGSFSSPRKITTDAYGNIYVDSYGNLAAEGKEGRIDVFDPQGFFITEVKQTGSPAGPRNIAVDSAGNLYVFDLTPSSSDFEVVRYEPSTYEPASGEIAYENSPVLVGKTGSGAVFAGLAVNPTNDHLFVHDITAEGSRIIEYSSAAEGNTLLASNIGAGALSEEASTAIGLAIDAAHDRIYASNEREVLAFELSAPHKLVASFDGSTTPATQFSTRLSVAADENTGHVFIFDGEVTNKIYEFTEDEEFLATVEHNIQWTPGAEIWVDNGANSPNGALNPDGRYLFVPSHATGVGHSFAFGPTPPVGPPVVAATSVSGVTETEARLQAVIEPKNLATAYTFEYTTEQTFEAQGFVGASVAGSGQVPAQAGSVDISAPARVLTPGVAYRFRVVVSNSEGSDEAEAGFATYPPAPEGACLNDALRFGPSALLPDCRAYELVTPPNTNARAPMGPGHLGSGYFATRGAAPDGGAVSFRIEGGAFPGAEATGSFAGDIYLSVREGSGWGTSYVGPSGAEAMAVLPGSNSPDQRHFFWATTGAEGSAVIGVGDTTYIRYPDGHSALVGRGSLGTDPRAEGKLISENGGHIIFISRPRNEEQKVSLLGKITGGTFTLSLEGGTTGPLPYDASASDVEAALSGLPAVGAGGVTVGSGNPGHEGKPGGPFTIEFTGPRGDENVAPIEGDATKLVGSGGSPSIDTETLVNGQSKLEPNAPDGAKAIYDRTADEVTHVVSLLPEDQTPSAEAFYEGASLDGRGVAFKVDFTLYLRYDNQKTFEIGEGVTFAGVSEGGRRIFYVDSGKLYAFDAVTETTIPFNSSGNVTPVNVSADGTTAYFASLNALNAGANPLGAKPKAGKWNLYRSREGALSFVGTVTARDVEGENPGNELVEGLGLWLDAVREGRFGVDPSRTTPDGHALVFESRAPLTENDTEGKPQVYRYDAAAGALQCISCDPTGAPATGDSSLQSISQALESPEPSSSSALIPNLRADGRRAIFQSTEALVASDTDGLQDVYEWEDQGVGSCNRAGGCVYLISSGHSARIDYLYAVSDSGDDVFFRSSDLLVGADKDETPSIYDVRVGGGFPEAAEGECEGEGCRPGVSPPPRLTPPATPAVGANDNLRPRCPKGKRKVRRHGKVRCVKKHRKHHHQRAGANKKGAHR